MGLFSKIKPLKKEQKELLDSLTNIISLKRIKLIGKLLKEGKVSLETEVIETSMAGSVEFVQIRAKANAIDTFDVNEDIRKAFEEKLFRRFAEDALKKISGLIAPNITGMEAVKKAAAIQLFAAQPVHMLLLGDPGTGKTDILRSSKPLTPIISSMTIS